MYVSREYSVRYDSGTIVMNAEEEGSYVGPERRAEGLSCQSARRCGDGLFDLDLT